MNSLYPKTDVSVIVPVYNGGDKFRRCLTDLTHCSPGPKEIIVVVDGATDVSLQIAEEFHVKVLKNARPSGPASARNMGASKAKGGILFFVDADVVVSQDAIDCITQVFKNDSELTACFGSYDDDPFETNFLSQFKNLFHHYHHQTANEDAFTFWGACGAIRRDLFLTLNGFDERYKRPSVEDIEFGYRLKKNGYKIKLLKDLQVKHLKRWGILSLLKSDIIDRAVPWTELIWELGSFNNDLNLKHSNRLSIMLIYGLLCSLLAGIWFPLIFSVSAIFVFLLLSVNVKLYKFFYKKRGIWFSVKSVLWHWAYYLYCGIGFGMGSILYFLKRFGLMKIKCNSGHKSQADRKQKKELGG